MKILIRQFFGGKPHSWATCGWGIANALIKQNHEVHIYSTDGITFTPENLKPYIIGYHPENEHTNITGRLPDPEYDCQISYTALKNFPYYLHNGSKNRFGIWCYEWAGKNILPTGFAKSYKYCDKLLPPSQFAKQVFLDSGIPENVITVIPHGITASEYQQTDIMELSTKKKYKILAVIGQLHIRKNIPGLLESYGKAFTNKDDVCLILRTKDKKVIAPFEISLGQCLNDFYQKYPKHAEVKILSDFIPDMSALYRSVDAVFTMTNCEAFYFPGLEAAASGKLSIAPNWGGQIDFSTNDNSLLIDGKEGRADPASMYWENKNNAIWFIPSINDAVDKLRYAYQNYEELNKKVEKQRIQIYEKYDWGTITNQIIGLTT